jgi:hypothetical protein
MGYVTLIERELPFRRPPVIINSATTFWRCMESLLRVSIGWIQVHGKVYKEALLNHKCIHTLHRKLIG